MSVVAKSGRPSPSTMDFSPEQQVGSGLICGEDIDAGDACYIASTGKVMKSGGSGVTALTDAGAQVDGFAAETAKVAQNDAVTLLTDIDWGYGSGLTPGKSVYLDVSAATKGRINDVSGITGTLRPCGRVIDDSRIRLFRANY